MPQRFRYVHHGGGHEGAVDTHFTCQLHCERCQGRRADGTRCTRRVCMGLQHCWQHTVRDLHLRIKPSGMAGAGKGLFAESRDHLEHEWVFRPGDKIVKYYGDVLTEEQVDHRYGEGTAPYAWTVGQNVVDAACRRGIAAFANHKPQSRANAKLAKNGYLVATKNIKNGSEIFVSYGRDFVVHDPDYAYSTR
jgi:hypothetical protein